MTLFGRPAISRGQARVRLERSEWPGMLPLDRNLRRWPRLLEAFEDPASAERLAGYASLDDRFMQRLGLVPDADG